MRKQNTILILILILLPISGFAREITHLVVFGDSLSDRGFSNTGGFNRYSNGKVWPEYLAEQLGEKGIDDYAWGGAKTDYGNFHGFSWSGILWQIEQYQLNSDLQKTLFVIFAGTNDLIEGKQSGLVVVKNIETAIQKLNQRGAKYIFIFTLPDSTLTPAYNNPKVADYIQFSSVKSIVAREMRSYNIALRKLPQKYNYVYLLELSDVYQYLIKQKIYKNITDPWFGTYQYPALTGYIWWDSWHPMTSVHKYIAERFIKTAKEKGFFMG